MDVGPGACQKDTPLPDDATLLMEAFASEGLRFPQDLDRSNSEALFAHALNWAKEAGWVPPYTELLDFRCYFQIYKLNGAALSRYAPTPYDGEITLFRCAAPGEGEAAEADLGWSRLAKRGVKIVQVPGDHHTIIKEPDVHELARELRVHLGQMSQNPGFVPNTLATAAHTSTILNASTQIR
jgi:thioesterase domain-containing protein